MRADASVLDEEPGRRRDVGGAFGRSGAAVVENDRSGVSQVRITAPF